MNDGEDEGALPPTLQRVQPAPPANSQNVNEQQQSRQFQVSSLATTKKEMIENVKEVEGAVNQVVAVFSKPEPDRQRLFKAVYKAVSGQMTIKEASNHYGFATSTMHPYVHRARAILGDKAPPMRSNRVGLTSKGGLPKTHYTFPTHLQNLKAPNKMNNNNNNNSPSSTSMLDGDGGGDEMALPVESSSFLGLSQVPPSDNSGGSNPLSRRQSVVEEEDQEPWPSLLDDDLGPPEAKVMRQGDVGFMGKRGSSAAAPETSMTAEDAAREAMSSLDLEYDMTLFLTVVRCLNREINTNQAVQLCSHVDKTVVETVVLKAKLLFNSCADEEESGVKGYHHSSNGSSSKRQRGVGLDDLMNSSASSFSNNNNNNNGVNTKSDYLLNNNNNHNHSSNKIPSSSASSPKLPFSSMGGQHNNSRNSHITPEEVQSSVHRAIACSHYQGKDKERLYIAVHKTVMGELPLTQAAAQYAVPFSTLHPYVKRAKATLGLIPMSEANALKSPLTTPFGAGGGGDSRNSSSVMNVTGGNSSFESSSPFNIGNALRDMERGSGGSPFGSHGNTYNAGSSRPQRMNPTPKVRDVGFYWRNNPDLMRNAVRRAVHSCQYDDPKKKERLTNAVIEALLGEKTMKAAAATHDVPFTTLQTYFHRARAQLDRELNPSMRGDELLMDEHFAMGGSRRSSAGSLLLPGGNHDPSSLLLADSGEGVDEYYAGSSDPGQAAEPLQQQQIPVQVSTRLFNTQPLNLNALIRQNSNPSSSTSTPGLVLDEDDSPAASTSNNNHYQKMDLQSQSNRSSPAPSTSTAGNNNNHTDDSNSVSGSIWARLMAKRQEEEASKGGEAKKEAAPTGSSKRKPKKIIRNVNLDGDDRSVLYSMDSSSSQRTTKESTPMTNTSNPVPSPMAASTEGADDSLSINQQQMDPPTDRVNCLTDDGPSGLDMFNNRNLSGLIRDMYQNPTTNNADDDSAVHVVEPTAPEDSPNKAQLHQHQSFHQQSSMGGANQHNGGQSQGSRISLADSLRAKWSSRNGGNVDSPPSTPSSILQDLKNEMGSTEPINLTPNTAVLRAIKNSQYDGADRERLRLAVLSAIRGERTMKESSRMYSIPLGTFHTYYHRARNLLEAAQAGLDPDSPVVAALLNSIGQNKDKSSGNKKPIRTKDLSHLGGSSLGGNSSPASSGYAAMSMMMNMSMQHQQQQQQQQQSDQSPSHALAQLMAAAAGGSGVSGVGGLGGLGLLERQPAEGEVPTTFSNPATDTEVSLVVAKVIRNSQYPPEQKKKLRDAIIRVIRGDMTINNAANVYQLPSSTVHPYVHRTRAILGTSCPPQAKLTRVSQLDLAFGKGTSSQLASNLRNDSPSMVDISRHSASPAANSFIAKYSNIGASKNKSSVEQQPQPQQQQQQQQQQQLAASDSPDRTESSADSGNHIRPEDLSLDDADRVVSELVKSSLYNEEGRQRLYEAILMVVTESSTVSEASRAYAIPPSTIQPYVTRARTALNLPLTPSVPNRRKNQYTSGNSTPTLEVKPPPAKKTVAAPRVFAAPGNEASYAEVEDVVGEVVKNSVQTDDRRERLYRAVLNAVSGTATIKDACGEQNLPASTVHPYVSKARHALGDRCPPPKIATANPASLGNLKNLYKNRSPYTLIQSSAATGSAVSSPSGAGGAAGADANNELFGGGGDESPAASASPALPLSHHLELDSLPVLSNRSESTTASATIQQQESSQHSAAANHENNNSSPAKMLSIIPTTPTPNEQSRHQQSAADIKYQPASGDSLRRNIQAAFDNQGTLEIEDEDDNQIKEEKELADNEGDEEQDEDEIPIEREAIEQKPKQEIEVEKKVDPSKMPITDRIIMTTDSNGARESLQNIVKKVLSRCNFRADREKVSKAVIGVVAYKKNLSEVAKEVGIAPTTLSPYVRLGKDHVETQNIKVDDDWMNGSNGLDDLELETTESEEAAKPLPSGDQDGGSNTTTTPRIDDINKEELIERFLDESQMKKDRFNALAKFLVISLYRKGDQHKRLLIDAILDVVIKHQKISLIAQNREGVSENTLIIHADRVKHSMKVLEHGISDILHDKDNETPSNTPPKAGKQGGAGGKGKQGGAQESPTTPTRISRRIQARAEAKDSPLPIDNPDPVINNVQLERALVNFAKRLLELGFPVSQEFIIVLTKTLMMKEVDSSPIKPGDENETVGQTAPPSMDETLITGNWADRFRTKHSLTIARATS